MQRIVPVAVLLVAALATFAAPAPAVATNAAAAGVEVVADLDGVPISVAQIPSFYCHDGDFPQIHCFATARDLEQARVATADAGLLSVNAVTYVIVYAQTGYSGSYLAISQDYATLAVVGWNDRIRSFYAANSELGRFWTDWFAGGSRLDFCCNAAVPSLSATFDQQISSVYRR